MIIIMNTYLDTVVHVNIWVGISDCSSIMGYNKWHLVGTHWLFLDLAKLERTLFLVDFVGLVSTLDIVEDSEELASLFNADDVHNTEREPGVSPDFVVDLDISILVLHDDGNFLSRHSIPQSVLKKNAKWNTLSGLVGPSWWLHSIFST
jgi:hypothetical protein